MSSVAKQTSGATRIEKDSMGQLAVPVDAQWGAQTQRAVNNFAFSDLAMPAAFVRALGLIKHAAASANQSLELIDEEIAVAIQKSAQEIIDGQHVSQFPIDVFQTGSGTSSNMNANEVIAKLASDQSGLAVHPNDHVN
ncbi:MAG: aspartate ammonia-lyase, partial [Gammaproteobacteria bacterium]|nr:aspartate ammonia-lyase [Gammaproteobacteria bacterium]